MLTTMLCDEIPATTGLFMQLSVRTVADLGLALRATRRSGKVRLDDLAQIAGVSKQFVSDVEYGKQTVQLGLVLKLLLEMGVFMSVEIPQEANEEWVGKVDGQRWATREEASQKDYGNSSHRGLNSSQ